MDRSGTYWNRLDARGNSTITRVWRGDPKGDIDSISDTDIAYEILEHITSHIRCSSGWELDVNGHSG